MPSGRCRPSAFGMYALRDGLARHLAVRAAGAVLGYAAVSAYLKRQRSR